MTRKDYVKLAEALNSAREATAFTDGEIHRYMTVRDVADRVADTLAAENPRFDRARFMKAAGFAEE